MKWSIEFQSVLDKHPKKRTPEEAAQVAAYEKTCWTCRGMSGAHYETEIDCPKHAADRSYFEAIGVNADGVFRLAALSDALDACVAARVQEELNKPLQVREVPGTIADMLRKEIAGA